jgi:hypothetical protein
VTAVLYAFYLQRSPALFDSTLRNITGSVEKAALKKAAVPIPASRIIAHALCNVIAKTHIGYTGAVRALTTIAVCPSVHLEKVDEATIRSLLDALQVDNADRASIVFRDLASLHSESPGGASYSHIVIGGGCDFAEEIDQYGAIYLAIYQHFAARSVSVIVSPGAVALIRDAIYSSLQESVVETKIEVHGTHATMLTLSIEGIRKRASQGLSLVPYDKARNRSTMEALRPIAHLRPLIGEHSGNRLVSAVTSADNQPPVYVLRDAGSEAASSALSRSGLSGPYKTFEHDEYSKMPIITNTSGQLLVLKEDRDLQKHTRPLFFKKEALIRGSTVSCRKRWYKITSTHSSKIQAGLSASSYGSW